MDDRFDIPADWEATVHESLKSDPLWGSEVYRRSLYVADASWPHLTILSRDIRTRDLCGQLAASLRSISENITEGFGRPRGPDRSRFYWYALGSARESRGWYYLARHSLPADEFDAQMRALTSIIRLLVVAIPQVRVRQDARKRRRALPTPEEVMNHQS